MSVDPVYQNGVNLVRVDDFTRTKSATPLGVAESQSSIQPSNRECCDVIPQKKAPSCWQKLSPGQKKVVYCGGLFGSAGGLIGGLYGAGVISSGTAGVIGVIALCCSVKIGICIAASRGSN